MTSCSSCGRELPESALFCPDCGAKAADFSVAQPGFSPSHFNTAMTSTSPPQTPVTPDDGGFAIPPTPSPETERRPASQRKRLVRVVIAVFAVLLVATAFESGILGTGPSSTVVNSASSPLTGEQLYIAYSTNQAQADASYTNKTLFIQDSLDFGVTQDFSSGQYYSSVNSGTVILIWSSQTQMGQLAQGATVLAKCSVEGAAFQAGTGYQVYLQDCDLINVQGSTATTTTSASVPVASL